MALSIWQTQEAKAKFSQLVKAALVEGDQFIIQNGELVVAILSKKKYDTLTHPSKSFLDFFKDAPLQEIELEIERRG